MYNIVRARSADNKLEVLDNRPFAIDIKLEEKGFICKFIDLEHGLETSAAFYRNRYAFDEEWELCEEIGDVEYKEYTYWRVD